MNRFLHHGPGRTIFQSGIQSTLVVGILFLFFISSAYADQTGTNYGIPFDVMNAGGADVSKSNLYLLSDSLGEPIVGFGASTKYILNSGYRQPSASDFISVSCSDIVNLGSVVGTGQKTGTGTCTVYTDAYDGYRMVWKAGSNNTYGLTSHWRLDETSGTNALDNVGGKNGTLTNGAAISIDVPSRYLSTRSVSFDGLDDLISTTASIPLEENTISMWIYLDSSSSKSFGQGIFWSYPNHTPHLMLSEKDGMLRTYNYNRVNTTDIGSGTNYSNVGAITTGQWNHVALVHENGVEVAYINGIRGAPVTYSSNGGSNGEFRLSWAYWGVNHANQDYLNGKVDDVRIFNRAMSTEEIQDLSSLAPPGSLTASGSQVRHIPGIFFPSTGGLVGHWKMEETFAGTVADSSGYNRDGTPQGATGANNTPQPVVNVPGSTSFLSTRSLDFDGTDDYLSVSTAAELASNPISVSFWTKNDVAPTQFDGLLGKTNGTNWTQGWGFFYNSASQVRFFIENYAANVAVASINPQEWNHIVGTWDGTTIRIYVNGVEGASDAYAGTITSSHPFEIGRLGGNAFNLDGKLDDVRIYNRVLSLAEVKALYSEPQAWSVAATESAWGARLSSQSTDTDSKWGTDGGSEKWLNLGDGSYTVVRRATATPLSGSVEHMEFRGEVGSSKIQTSGVYRGVATFTVVGY